MALADFYILDIALTTNSAGTISLHAGHAGHINDTVDARYLKPPSETWRNIIFLVEAWGQNHYWAAMLGSR